MPGVPESFPPHFFANAAGEPLARVPLAETIPRIVSAPFLSFLAAKVFRVLRDAAKGSAFGIRKLLKKLEQNFYRLRHSRRKRWEERKTFHANYMIFGKGELS